MIESASPPVVRTWLCPSVLTPSRIWASPSDSKSCQGAAQNQKEILAEGHSRILTTGGEAVTKKLLRKTRIQELATQPTQQSSKARGSQPHGRPKALCHSQGHARRAADNGSLASHIANGIKRATVAQCTRLRHTQGTARPCDPCTVDRLRPATRGNSQSQLRSHPAT